MLVDGSCLGTSRVTRGADNPYNLYRWTIELMYISLADGGRIDITGR